MQWNQRHQSHQGDLRVAWERTSLRDESAGPSAVVTRLEVLPRDRNKTPLFPFSLPSSLRDLSLYQVQFADTNQLSALFSPLALLLISDPLPRRAPICAHLVLTVGMRPNRASQVHPLAALTSLQRPDIGYFDVVWPVMSHSRLH